MSLIIDNEFRQLIPPLLEEEYKQLEQNILAKGKCLNKIILWDGIIIDGHNRFYICMQHGIEFEVEDIYFDSRDEAKLWILENQLGRRNLTDAARIELALKKEGLLKDLAKKNLSAAGGDKYEKETPLFKTSTASEEPINVRKAIAKEAKVSETNLFRYKQIMEQGSPALIEAVKSGKLKIGTAYKMLPTQVLKQLDRANKMYAYVQDYLPSITDEREKADVEKQISALKDLLKALIEGRETYEIKI